MWPPHVSPRMSAQSSIFGIKKARNYYDVLVDHGPAVSSAQPVRTMSCFTLAATKRP